MIVPRAKLLLWTALLLPYAAVAGVVPEAAVAAAAVLAVFTATIAVDAVLALRRPPRIDISPADVVRLARDRRGAIPLTLRHALKRPAMVRIGLGLPPHLGADHDTLEVPLDADMQALTLEWACKPGRRGCFELRECRFEASSPLGMWAARGRSDCCTELRVYPNLLSQRKRLAALFLNRSPFGLHAQRMIGQGREFEKLRDYMPGDSYEDIHWKATAKRGHPVTKLFQLEKTQEIYVAIDNSRLSALANKADPALESFVTAALILGLAAEQQGDLFGLATFNHRVERFVRAAGGSQHFSVCRDLVYTVQPCITTPDFEEFFSFVRLRLRRRALIVVLTDLADPVLSDAFLRAVELVCRQHVVLVCMPRRPGADPLFSVPDAVEDGDLYEKLGGHLRWKRLKETEQRLRRLGVGLSVVDQDELGSEVVTRYMEIKARQAL